MTETCMLEVAVIEANLFNPNRMARDEYEAMKDEMEEKGWEAIDTVKVSPAEDFYPDADIEERTLSRPFVIIDGYHRWKAAEELGITHLSAVIKPMSEAEAKEVCYRKNRERGSIDPYLEALMFKGEADLVGMTHEEIGGKYGRTRDYVTRCIGILRVPAQVRGLYEEPEVVFPEFKKQAMEAAIIEVGNERFLEAVNSQIEATGRGPTEEEERQIQVAIDTELREYPRYSFEDDDLVPSGTLTKSHLEVISTLPTENLMYRLAMEVINDDMTVRRTARQAARFKATYEKAEALRKALEEALIKVCPKCGREPDRVTKCESSYFGVVGKLYLECKDRYSCETHWMLDISLEHWKAREARKEKRKKNEKEKDGEKGETQKVDWIRHTLTQEDIDERIGQYLTRMFRNLSSVQRVNIEATRKDGENIEIDYYPERQAHSLSIEIGAGYEEMVGGGVSLRQPKIKFSLTYEKKDYRAKNIQHLKTLVRLPYNAARIEDNYKLLATFLEEGVLGDEDPQNFEKREGW